MRHRRCRGAAAPHLLSLLHRSVCTRRYAPAVICCILPPHDVECLPNQLFSHKKKRKQPFAAGVVCQSCGEVLGTHDPNAPSGGGPPRTAGSAAHHPPSLNRSAIAAVSAKPETPPGPGLRAQRKRRRDGERDGVRPAAAACPAEAEWRQHTGRLLDQAAEVLKSARLLFCEVYMRGRPVTGMKARALALVCLLYSLRKFRDDGNGRNEAYLLQTLAVPTRLMNRAFTSLVAVAGPQLPQDSHVL